jgi:hypothetical protein
MDNGGNHTTSKNMKQKEIIISILAANKNHFLINMLCGELLRIGRFIDVSCNFLIAGHTKFYPDLLFAIISIALHNMDILNHLYV